MNLTFTLQCSSLALMLGLVACVTVRPTSLARAPVPDLTASDQEVAWMCPMHPDFTAAGEGRCPRCGMLLVLGHPFDMRDYRLDFTTVPAIARAGEKLTLNFGVSHPDTGEAIKEFELVHDMPYHLFLISQDMEYFQHLHPKQVEDGSWSIDVVLPRPGAYSVLSDFLPKGGSSQFLARPLVTAGYDGDVLAQRAHLVPDESAIQTVDDLTGAVSYDPPVLRAGSYGHITFHLTDTGSNEPVRQLQPYLGAFGHMLIMDEDMFDYVHAHPTDVSSPGLKIDDLRGGPEVVFEGLMPKPGRYRAWTQFRYHDKIHTFVNTFEVLDIGERASR